MSKDKKKRVQKLKYTIEEISALARIASNPDFQVLKRVIRRYIGNLKDISYKLPEDNPQYLAKRHAELVGMGLGAKQVIIIIENSDRKLDLFEDELEKLKEGD